MCDGQFRCSHGGRAKSKPLKSLQCLGFSEMFSADVLRQLQGYLKRASEKTGGKLC